MKNNAKTLSLCLGFASLALGQTTTAPIYTASIYAGQPSYALGDGGPANVAVIASPQGIAVGPDGGIYISDNTNGRVRRIDTTTGLIETFATPSGPNGLAFDTKGHILVASGGSHIINMYTLTAKIPAAATLIAGESGNNRYSGDGYHAVDAPINSPGGVAIDNAGNVYIADTSNNRIRMVPNSNNCIYDAPTACLIYTIAGPGILDANTANDSAAVEATGVSFGVANQSNTGTNTVGVGGLAVLARVDAPFGIAVSPDGSTVYFSDTSDNRIRVINMGTGIISNK